MYEIFLVTRSINHRVTGMSISKADTEGSEGSIAEGSLALDNQSLSSSKSEALTTNDVAGCVDANVEYAMQLLGFTPKTFCDGCMQNL